MFSCSKIIFVSGIFFHLEREMEDNRRVIHNY